VESEIEMLKMGSDHPSIVAFHGFYRDASGVLCLVLGYCEGGALDALTAQQGATQAYFAEQQILEWFAQLLSALHHLHQKRILHRDIKTSNCFLSKDLRIVRLGDLGIAKQLDSTQDLAHTRLGSPCYMSPEQVRSALF